MPYVKCIICNNKFYAKPRHLKVGWGKYCSKKCQFVGQRKGKEYICTCCGKKIYRPKSEIKKSKSGKFFCNKSCQTIWRNKYYSGTRHPNWKNGKHQDYRNFLKDANVKPICKNCSISDKRILEVHHVDKNRKNNKVSNLVWLCLNCHYLIHHHDVKVK